MTLRSALYVGSVMHRRHAPVRHHFRYRAFWLLLDLDEVETLSGALRWFSHNRPNLFSFYDRDHGDGSEMPLRTQVDRRLAEAGIDLAGGRVRLLSMPRTFGCGFNPLSILFCHDAKDRLVAVIYQVHNTFGERHSYLAPVERKPEVLSQHCKKRFYVSPFLDMDLRYHMRIAGPGDRIVVGICASAASGPVLHAALQGQRRGLTDRALVGLALMIPAVTAKVVAAIHWEALLLWLKRIPLRPRPRSEAAAPTAQPVAKIVN